MQIFIHWLAAAYRTDGFGYCTRDCRRLCPLSQPIPERTAALNSHVASIDYGLFCCCFVSGNQQGEPKQEVPFISEARQDLRYRCLVATIYAIPFRIEPRHLLSLIDSPAHVFAQFSITRVREGNHAKDRADLRIGTCSEGGGISRYRVEEAEMLKNSKAGSPRLAALRSRVSHRPITLTTACEEDYQPRMNSPCQTNDKLFMFP